ncbi:type I restriction-modification system subunit M [uncultured Bacteroides sp.]|uniref:type I restriction-modification system subunit M n=1 Tax=uncultured Bacteroides sp. TaxID=162156 RepID=UPI00267043D0|nr:N-6 DNA methylase [uncultured Bacteroides sp.]
MKTQKIKLSRLERLLQDVADTLRGKMDAAEYKEYILGMLFLKRMSDVFDQKRTELRKRYKHLPKSVQDELLEERTPYGETFFVPKRARWHESWVDENGNTVPPIKHLKNDIGSYLNKALAAIEEENSERLSGIFKDRINFNRQVNGKPVVKNADLETIIGLFNKFPALINDNFEFPDLLGAAYEYILKFFADEAGKKGGQFYTPGQVVRLLVQLLEVEEGMKILDPTVGSGGMLIQSHQWLEEQGKNANNLSLYGQENDPAVVALSQMNLILHNISNYHIYYGDTIGNPETKEDGQLIKFDRVIANPPFSQNYTRAEMEFPERFVYGFLPETGKKADLMFVQHMLAVCKNNGRVVVVMPHGVLFRGGKEKEVRRLMIDGTDPTGQKKKGIKSDIIEGIIGLPPQLFYGTGIPACIMVFNKQKPQKLRNKIFFINADREYLDGKKQNMLRPEDIEKISTIFKAKIDVPGYSRLVEVREISNEANDYTLNIRRYVDNTPPLEPHNVTAHLKGGIPNNEIKAISTRLGEKFHFNLNDLFINRTNSIYSDFAIGSKIEIKCIVEESKGIKASYGAFHFALLNWWEKGREIFAAIAKNDEANLPSIRQQLIATIHKALLPLNLLDRFQISGIFVRWWDSIKYDLKTIRQRGWDIDLINNEEFRHLIVDKYFAKQQFSLNELRSRLTSQERELSILVEEALELCEYEPDENEKLTPKLAKLQISANVANLSKEDTEPYDKALNDILDKEASIKKTKDECTAAEQDLMLNVELKCYGIEEQLIELENQRLICKHDIENAEADLTVAISPIAEHLENITSLESIKSSIKTLKSALRKADKKDQSTHRKVLLDSIAKVEASLKPFYNRFKNLRNALDITNGHISYINQVFSEMGGSVTEEERREMILQKHYLIINSEMLQYVDSERRLLVAAFENLWDKYAVSAKKIKELRDNSLDSLISALSKLHYLD